MCEKQFSPPCYKASCIIEIDPDKCDCCARCIEYCPTQAIVLSEKRIPRVLIEKCICCYGCTIVCEKQAIRIRWVCKRKVF